MRFRKLVGTVCVVSCLVAACGSDDDTASDDADSASTSLPSATPTVAGTTDADTATTDADTATTDADTATTDAATTSPDEPAIDPDGVLRVGFPQSGPTLDPILEPSIGARAYWLPIYETLYDVGEGTTIVPLAAADMPTYSDDGLTITIPLREGRSFHDGTPIDAAAAAANLDRAMTTEGSTAKPNLALVTNVSVVDEYTIEITLSAPRPGWVSNLVGGAGALVSPQAIEAGVDIGLNPGNAGSGPFIVDEFVPNEFTRYTAVEDYDLRDDWGRVKTLEISAIATDAAVSALQTGELEVFYAGATFDPSVEDQLTGAGLVVYPFPSLNVQGLQLRITMPPLDNKLVRQALSHAIDRQLIADSLFPGKCQVNQQPFAEGLPTHTPGYEPFPYDPDRARELLAEAGYPDGFTLDAVSLQGFSFSENQTLAVQQMFADVGVTLEITPMAAADALPAFTADRIQMFSGVTPFRQDALGTVEFNFLAGGARHIAVPEDAPLAELLSELQAADPEDQDGILQEIGKYITDSAFTLPLCTAGTDFASTPNVIGLEDTPYRFYGIIDARGLALTT